MDGNYQDDDKDTENTDTDTDATEPDTPDETEPVDEAVESMTLLDLARGMASGEVSRDTGRDWLAENHPY